MIERQNSVSLRRERPSTLLLVHRPEIVVSKLVDQFSALVL